MRNIPTKWMGPYIGYTIMGPQTPVFFDPHTQIASNNPPGVYISGSPGGGKTFFSMTLAWMSAVAGKITVYLDPKADSVKLLNLKNEIGDVNVWNLADENAEPGILDPFSIEKDPGKQRLLVTSLISIFMGTLTDKQKNVLSPIIKDVSNERKPSLNKVMALLRQNRKSEEARALGNDLMLLRDLPFSKLCFDHYEGDSLKIGKGLTIITLLGLHTPEPGQDPSEYNINDRLGMGIMYLVTNFIRSVMMSEEQEGRFKHYPKTIIIDESWSVMATQTGRTTISEICRLGRSLNTSCILISQNADDVDTAGIQNSISTRFAFRVKTLDEGKRVRESLDLPEDIHIEQAMVDSFQQGDCIMKDFNNNIAAIHIDGYYKTVTDAFNTNPFGD